MGVWQKGVACNVLELRAQSGKILRTACEETFNKWARSFVRAGGSRLLGAAYPSQKGKPKKATRKVKD